MAATCDLKTNSLIFTDGITGNVRGIIAQNDNIDFINGAAGKIARLNNVAIGNYADLPASELNGLWYYCQDTEALYLDNGTSQVCVIGTTLSFVDAEVNYLGQSFESGNITKVQFNDENHDDLNEFDPVTHFRFTAQTAGKYHVLSQITSANVDDNTKFLVLRVMYNSMTQCSQALYNLTALAEATYYITDIVPLSAGDYIEITAYTNQPAGFSIEPGSFLRVRKLT